MELVIARSLWCGFSCGIVGGYRRHILDPRSIAVSDLSQGRGIWPEQTRVLIPSRGIDVERVRRLNPMIHSKGKESSESMIVETLLDDVVTQLRC
jgi:hypothetical protein